MSDEVTQSRILLIGKANAGKTSILKKICGETEIPIVYDRDGKVLAGLPTLNPTLARGMHDINYEIIYPSRPRFSFYDSRGIESGSAEEIDKVANFIARRSAMPLDQRLHATWICLPLDDERPVGETELRMLGLKDSGGVPIVVVFTKYDGLETRALNTLRREGQLKPREAFRAMAATAERLFKEHWLNRIYTVEPPKPPFVRLKDLHKQEGNCQDLMDCTLDVLKDNEPAKKMFVVAQEYNLQKRMEWAVPDVVELLLSINFQSVAGLHTEVARRVLSWMPHVYERRLNTDWLWMRETFKVHNRRFNTPWPATVNKFVETIPYTGPLEVLPFQQSLQMLAGTIIVADHCFWTMDRDATNQKDDFKVNWKNMNDGLQSTIQIYLSQRQEAVMEAIVEGFPEPDILSLSVMSRLKLDQGKERDKKESDLTEELLKLVLKYRLPMPLQRVSQVASGSK